MVKRDYKWVVDSRLTSGHIKRVPSPSFNQLISGYASEEVMTPSINQVQMVIRQSPGLFIPARLLEVYLFLSLPFEVLNQDFVF